MATIPTPPRDELAGLRRLGMNREQIADHYGVALSRVKRWIKDLDIPPAPPPISSGEKVKHKSSEGETLGADYGLTLVERAKLSLGQRVVEDRHRGYLLDGRPVRVDMLIRAAGLSLPDQA